VDALLRGGCCGLCTTGALDVVLLRPPVLDDEVAVAVRHVRGGVRRPQGAEVVRPLPGVACACGAHCSERPPQASSPKFSNLIQRSKISDADKYV
jgi:hypothetical protein